MGEKIKKMCANPYYSPLRSALAFICYDLLRNEINRNSLWSFTLFQCQILREGCFRQVNAKR
jgi:hypothetical protein